MPHLSPLTWIVCVVLLLAAVRAVYVWVLTRELDREQRRED